MRKIRSSYVLVATALVACANHPINAQEVCPIPPFAPAEHGNAYFPVYTNSIPISETMHLTPPAEMPFERLWVMPDNPSIEFDAWVRDEITNTYSQESVEIENPVIVMSLIAINFNGICVDGNTIWPNMRPLERFTSRCELYGGNLWVSIDGNMSQYFRDDLDIDLNCLSPTANLALSQGPCANAIALAVPAVGMPYAFGEFENNDPYTNPDDSGAWWMNSALLFVAERDSFVRPSYNPTVGPGTKEMPTNGGVPIWDSETHSYRLAREGDPTYEAQHEILEDFVGYINPIFGSPSDDPDDPTYCEDIAVGGCGGMENPYIGPEGYELWLHDWEQVAWESAPHFRFPFLSVGLTGNWQTWATQSGPPTQTMPAISEFILKGDQDVYVLGNWPLAQYLAPTQPNQVAWCDSCSGDLNSDSWINGEDLNLLLSRWGEPNTCANLDKSSPYVDGGALLRLLNKWGPCPEWPLPEMRPSGCE